MEAQRTFCIFLSYVGTYFRGSQYQVLPLRTVQNSIQDALKRCLRKDHDVPVKMASRTDSGVHAITNVASFSLKTKARVDHTLLGRLHSELNDLLRHGYEPIRVTGVKVVADGYNQFDCQKSAIKKHYVYRLAVLPSETNVSEYLSSMSAFDSGSIGLVRQPKHGFSMEKLHMAAEILSGVHDYTLFRVEPKDLYNKHLQRVVRECNVSVEPGSPMFADSLGNEVTDTQYLNILFSSRGFMHKQIRYMVGAMVAVAEGKLYMSRLKELLSNPELGLRSDEIPVARASGLYLTHIIYPPHCLV